MLLVRYRIWQWRTAFAVTVRLGNSMQVLDHSLLVNRFPADSAFRMAASEHAESVDQRQTVLRTGSVNMGEYFKPFRRKIGVITLVMACVFSAGWIRSRNTSDFLRLNVGRDQIVFSFD